VRRRKGKITTRLVALSSSAILTVYSIGYVRTRTAAQRIDAAERPRVTIPIPAAASQPVAPAVVSETATAKPVASTPAKPKPARQTPWTAPPPVTSIPAGIPQPAPSAVAAEPPLAPPPPPPATPAPAALYKDGTYSGWGTSRHGDIEATVVIENGRIASANISQCLTRYSCSLIAHLQGQVVTRQSPDVDYVSGATQSTNAFYDAVVNALAKAR
jgi:uncharacterized protein with FMN-binding domain